MELVWFKGYKWLKDSIKINTPYVIYGKLNYFKGVFSVVVSSGYFQSAVVGIIAAYPRPRGSLATVGGRNFLIGALGWLLL